MKELFRLTAVEARSRINAGTLSAEALVKSCLERIAAREPKVHAWAFIDPAFAIRQAQRLDRMKRPRGVLHGIPVGIKDIIDTTDMPTQFNSPIYHGHRPRRDADCVTRLREAGAIIMGKTETAEFAFKSPAQTRNPVKLGYTPGGSSSGSAAGVGDFMVPLALGTQTGGSTIRPASYCGVFALKPSYRRLSMFGVKSVSATFDTLGLFARSIDDLSLLDAVLTGEIVHSIRSAQSRLRIGYCQTPFWNKAEMATRQVMQKTASTLRRAGIVIEAVELPDDVIELSDGFADVQAMEAAWALGPEYRDHKKLLSQDAGKLIEKGLAVDPDHLQLVRAAQLRCILAVDRLFDRYDVLLTPAAPGEPGKKRAVGNNLFNRMWTAMYLPCLAIPAGLGPGGLPIGIQLVGRNNADRKLLTVGYRVARAIASISPRTARE